MVILYILTNSPLRNRGLLVNIFLVSQFVTGALSMALNGYIVAIFAISSHFRKLEYYPLARNCLIDIFGAGIVAIVAEVGLFCYILNNEPYCSNLVVRISLVVIHFKEKIFVSQKINLQLDVY